MRDPRVMLTGWLQLLALLITMNYLDIKKERKKMLKLKIKRRGKKKKKAHTKQKFLCTFRPLDFA